MTPGLPSSAPVANVPATSTWLLLALVLTTLLAVGRWTQLPAALASPAAPARPVPTARRVALGHPARPHAGAGAALTTAAL